VNALAAGQVVVQLHEGYAPLVEGAIAYAGVLLATQTATLLVLAFKR
jgi:hypothetical protein